MGKLVGSLIRGASGIRTFSHEYVLDVTDDATIFVLEYRTKCVVWSTMASLLDALITSNTRVRILMRLFLNPEGQAYLRELAEEFAMSPSQVKGELDQLSKAGLLVSVKEGRHVNFRANRKHPLFPELHSMVQKALGMDRILDSIVQRLGRLEWAFLLDDYAVGKDTGIIDLGLVGDIDHANLIDLTAKTERYIGRKIRTLVLSRDEYERLRPALERRPVLTVWKDGRIAVAQPPSGGLELFRSGEVHHGR